MCYKAKLIENLPAIRHHPFFPLLMNLFRIIFSVCFTPKFPEVDFFPSQTKSPSGDLG